MSCCIVRVGNALAMCRARMGCCIVRVGGRTGDVPDTDGLAHCAGKANAPHDGRWAICVWRLRQGAICYKLRIYMHEICMNMPKRMHCIALRNASGALEKPGGVW